MEEKTIQQKLLDIQQKLEAPKGQYNEFGRYKYRSCEDILNALKPHLKENGLTLVIEDSLEYIGDRYYVRAMAYLGDGETCITAKAYAREEETKKGMDASQITGAASSYARKYALNGLFAIDDTKDADTQDNTGSGKKVAKAEATTKPRYATMKQIKLMVDKAKWGLKTYDKDEIVNWLFQVLGKDLNKIEMSEVDEALQKIDEALRSVKVHDALADEPKDEMDTVITDLPENINLDNVPY